MDPEWGKYCLKIGSYNPTYLLTITVIHQTKKYKNSSAEDINEPVLNYVTSTVRVLIENITIEHLEQEQ